MSFKPYYDATISERINTPAEHRLVRKIMGMSAAEVLQLRDEVNADVAIDPKYRSTRDYTLRCKAGIRRCQILKQNSIKGLTFFEKVGLTIGGMILGDEFADRFFT